MLPMLIEVATRSSSGPGPPLPLVVLQDSYIYMLEYMIYHIFYMIYLFDTMILHIYIYITFYIILVSVVDCGLSASWLKSQH